MSAERATLPAICLSMVEQQLEAPSPTCFPLRIEQIACNRGLISAHQRDRVLAVMRALQLPMRHDVCNTQMLWKVCSSPAECQCLACSVQMSRVLALLTACCLFCNSFLKYLARAAF